MKLFPIIPIWIMLILCIGTSLFILKHKKHIKIELLLIILLFLINLRVMIPSSNAMVESNNLDVLFVVDTTLSMKASDYQNKTRLDGVLEIGEQVINTLNGARFSIISFGNVSTIVTPYTNDTTMTLDSLEILSPTDQLVAKGSSLNTPLDHMIECLEASHKKGGKKRIVFFMSDGEITNNSSLESFKKIKKYIDNGAVLGFGTSTGGQMYVKNSFGEMEYIMDNEKVTQKAVSKIDEKNLQKIANDMNVGYIHVTKKEDIEKKLQEIKAMSSSTTTSSDKRFYKDTYYLLVIPFYILLLVLFKSYKRSI